MKREAFHSQEPRSGSAAPLKIDSPVSVQSHLCEARRLPKRTTTFAKSRFGHSSASATRSSSVQSAMEAYLESKAKDARDAYETHLNMLERSFKAAKQKSFEIPAWDVNPEILAIALKSLTGKHPEFSFTQKFYEDRPHPSEPYAFVRRYYQFIVTRKPTPNPKITPEEAAKFYKFMTFIQNISSTELTQLAQVTWPEDVENESTMSLVSRFLSKDEFLTLVKNYNNL